MPSSSVKCPLCNKSLGKVSKKEVTTACGHTFHHGCAEEYIIKEKSNDCPKCHKESALEVAPTEDRPCTDNHRDSPHVKTHKKDEKIDHDASASSIISSHLANANPKKKNEDEWRCSKCSMKNPISAKRCESCAEPKYSSPLIMIAPTRVLVGEESSDSTLSATTNPPIRHSNGKKNDYDNRPTMKVTANELYNQNQKKQEKVDWECRSCGNLNSNLVLVCIKCKKPNKSEKTNHHAPQQSPRELPPVRRPFSSLTASSNSVPKIYPYIDDDSYSSPRLTSVRTPLPKIGSTVASSKKNVKPSEGASITDTNAAHHHSDAKSSKEKTQPQPQVLVYISDLPLDIEDDHELEKLISDRLDKALKIQLSEIKCYSKLGVGFMRVSGNEVKNDLINGVGKLTLNPKEEKPLISFVDTLKFISYIVLNVSKEKKDFVLPTAEEVSHRWAELYKGERPLSCNQLNIQFPNIYRIVSTSLDELLSNMHHHDFRIKDLIAQIYFGADCSFLENLPRSITQDQLQSAIATAIKQPNIPSTSLCIQINTQMNSACIIVTDKARQWSTNSSLTLDGKSISKKDNLTCRLLVHPVPQTFPIQDIIQHPDLLNKVITHQHTGENLILEISDKNIFDACVNHGVIRINDKHIFHIEVYCASNNPEGSEIDTETWYETQMIQYKTDNIMPFIADPQHVIFRYKWNSQIWLERFKQVETPKQDGKHKQPRDEKGTTADQIRHQLQVTVMLNTLASIRKKSYLIGDQEVKLNLNDNLKTIVYNHESKLEKGGKMPLTNTPYPKTIVHVANDDCVVVYEQLVKKGKRPLLLNMASATSPGGGYRKGDGAQEENLFRRSDYFRSLDVGLDKFLPQSSQRFHCSSNCQVDTLSDHNSMYPMNEYAAIYTAGLTFFRHSQDVGYPYMDKPIENVCAVAMAAYRDPKLDGNMLAPKYAVGTRKKIENTFAIAYHHKHDSLVLSAFGCGAFRNPPSHIAKLFLSVIEQYAGFFDSITFAIIDDHNAGQRLNPDGNFKPFTDIFDGMIVNPVTPMNKPNTMFGPYRLSSDGSTVRDICIFDSTPCNFGGKCTGVYNPTHTREYSHPSFCAHAATTGKCHLTDDIVHMISFIHRNQCQYGGECRQLNDAKHTAEFEHPTYCSSGGNCQNVEEDHLKQFCHLPLCKSAQKCMDYQKHIKKHCDAFRHCKPRCPYGSFCANFHDTKHTSELQHPFPTPCPCTPFHCALHTMLSEANDTGTLTNEIQQHCLDFAHVCRFGRNCTDQTSLHWEKTIHIARYPCPYDDKCIKLNQEDHLNSFTHSKIVDIRRLCKYAEKCHDRQKVDHIVKFRHAIPHDDSGVVRYYGLNNNLDFVKNQNDSIARVFNYVKDQNWDPLPSGSVPEQILDWFRNVKPVHRCNPTIFESILLHGHVMSRDYMEKLKVPKFVANSVMQHSRVRRIEDLNIPRIEKDAKEYITAIVSVEFDKAEQLAATAATPGAGSLTLHQPRPGSASHATTIKKKEKILLNTVPQRDLDALKAKAIEIAQASIKLHSNPAGIGHAPDKALGTDKHVFSILGPHLGHYYGDVFIVFKREILHHPDANFSIQAATSFVSGNAYKLRPWLGTDPTTATERINLYHSSKLHASIPGYEYAIALELMALTSHSLDQKTMAIDLQTILKRWVAVDSHQNIEAHLPQLIPLDYIDHIYIAQNIFDSLSLSTRKAIDAVFKYCITVTPHQGDANQEQGPFGPAPTSPLRQEYQNYVVEELMKQYNQNPKYPPSRPIRGAVVTIPPTDFSDSYLLPLTISQAYDQHRIDHQQPSTENIAYIYWQIMNGDMMIVLSNEPIDSDDQQQPNLRCLICYIAPKPASYDTSYHELSSYLNCGQPTEHHKLVSKNKYKAKSNTFHVGCNTDDFITYCLEIHRSTGKVILRNAGSNSIYNNEEISCEFTAKELDVTKLEFIHVSAGAHRVPVRNLMVCFERQTHSHPTFDKDFKRNTSPVAAARATGASGDDNHAKSADDSPVKSKGLLAQAKSFFLGNDASSLKPCPDNINCLLQYATDASTHNSKFSHPCRFSELCRNNEVHLTHEPHPSPLCNEDKSCDKLIDPFHRAEYRHTNLPDFLVPCRQQAECRDKSNEHRKKYSHGEQVFEKQPTAAMPGIAANPIPQQQQKDHRYPCKWGSECRAIGDVNHTAKYYHPKPQQPKATLSQSDEED